MTDSNDAKTDSRTLRRALKASLPPYMVPASFVVMDQLPLTPNGKVDRKALPKAVAQEEGDRAAVFDQPVTPVEKSLAAMWCGLLGVPRVGRGDDFFELGGTSLLAVSLFAKIDREFGQRLPLVTLFETSTLEKLARKIRAQNDAPAPRLSLIPIQAEGAGTPLYLVHGAAGNILLYRALAQRLAGRCPVFGFQARGIHPNTEPCHHIEEMAACYLEELREFQPRGPYRIGGYCMGGSVAFHMAKLLRESGETVSLVALLDTYNLALVRPPDSIVERVDALRQKVSFHWSNLSEIDAGGRSDYLREKFRMLKEMGRAKVTSLFRDFSEGASETPAASDSGTTLEGIHDAAAYAYKPQPIDGSMVVFKTRKTYDFYPDPKLGWGGLVRGKLEVVELPVNPHAMLVEPYVEHLAASLESMLRG